MDRHHKIRGTAFVDRDDARRQRAIQRLKRPPVCLSAGCRTVVRRTILEVAEHRYWTVHALSVRSNHVHVVVSASENQEQVMAALKSWSTRRMVATGLLKPGTKPWARHGSTRYLWKREQLHAACRYVLDGQGPDL